MTRVQCAVVSAVVSLAGIGVSISAQVPVTVAVRTVRAVPITVGRLISASARGVDVIGIVQNHMGIPVPNAGTVVIRELQSGTVASKTDVDASAQFSIRSLPPGLYMAELVSRSGSVIASTPAFIASAGEVVEISQTIPAPPLHALARAFRSATEAALSSAASAGVLAIGRGAPVTPGS